MNQSGQFLYSKIIPFCSIAFWFVLVLYLIHRINSYIIFRDGPIQAVAQRFQIIELGVNMQCLFLLTMFLFCFLQVIYKTQQISLVHLP